MPFSFIDRRCLPLSSCFMKRKNTSISQRLIYRSCISSAVAVKSSVINKQILPVFSFFILIIRKGVSINFACRGLVSPSRTLGTLYSCTLLSCKRVYCPHRVIVSAVNNDSNSLCLRFSFRRPTNEILFPLYSDRV